MIVCLKYSNYWIIQLFEFGSFSPKMPGKAKETYEDNLKNTNNYLMYLFLDEISADTVFKYSKNEQFHSFKTLCWIEAEHAVLFCLRTWAWFGLRLRRRRLSSQICIDPCLMSIKPYPKEKNFVLFLFLFGLGAFPLGGLQTWEDLFWLALGYDSGKFKLTHKFSYRHGNFTKIT